MEILRDLLCYHRGVTSYLRRDSPPCLSDRVSKIHAQILTEMVAYTDLWTHTRTVRGGELIAGTRKTCRVGIVGSIMDPSWVSTTH